MNSTSAVDISIHAVSPVSSSMPDPFRKLRQVERDGAAMFPDASRLFHASERSVQIAAVAVVQRPRRAGGRRGAPGPTRARTAARSRGRARPSRSTVIPAGMAVASTSMRLAAPSSPDDLGAEQPPVPRSASTLTVMRLGARGSSRPGWCPRRGRHVGEAGALGLALAEPGAGRPRWRRPWSPPCRARRGTRRSRRPG